MRIFKKYFFALLFLYAISAFVPDHTCAAGPTTITGNISNETTWTKENGPYIVMGQVLVQSPLVIEPGTVVKFGKSSSLDSLKIQSDFFVNGTADDPVVFTSIHDDSDGNDSDKSTKNPQKGDWTAVIFNPAQDEEMKIKNAEVRYSSFGFHIIPSAKQTKTISVKRCKIENNSTGVLIGNAEPTIEDNLFKNNTVGIRVASTSSKKTLAVNNSISGNETGAWARSSLYPDSIVLGAENNWWGDESGPSNEKNPNGKGDKAIGQASFDPWMKESPIDNPDPVVIIPGIMGSWKNSSGQWEIDPIFHTYDNLRDEFLDNGYQKGKNYFEFPYEWRDSNVDNAMKLKNAIDEIKKKTERPKIDIVAHSMGGLMAREYIESDYYGDDVDQLITLGTPQLGAPKDYIKWEAGAFFSDIFETAGKKIFENEAKENGFDSIFHYIHGRPMSSVRELLPVYDYLYDDNGTGYDLRKGYPTNYPRNEFLEKLNSPENIERLKNIEFTKIIGRKNDSESTISGYNTISANMGELWKDGYPHGFEIPLLSDQGLRTEDGDITVPLFSSENIKIIADRNLYYSASHNDLPTEAQQNILEILTRKKPTEKIDKWRAPDLLLISAHSPIDLQVESPGGKRIGKNFETGGVFEEIEGAYYTGFGTNSEFITIPNPEDGLYQINVQGTGEGGHYGVETVKISENPDDPKNAKESSVMIESEIQAGGIREDKIKIENGEVIQDIDAAPPAINISSPQEMDYTNDGALEIDYSAEDFESGVASDFWQVEKDGASQNWTERNIDLSLVHLGSYEFSARAVDNAGNEKLESRNFRVITNIGAIKNNLPHYFSLGLIKKKAALKYFSKKINILQKAFGILEKARNSKLKPKPKQMAVNALEKNINKQVGLIMRQIKRKAPQWFDPQASEFLIEDFNYIKIINH